MPAPSAAVQATPLGDNRADEQRRGDLPGPPVAKTVQKVALHVQELAEQSKELLQQQLQTQLEANQAKRAQVSREACSCTGSAATTSLGAPELRAWKPGPPIGQVEVVLIWQGSRQPSQIIAVCIQTIPFSARTILQSCWQPISSEQYHASLVLLSWGDRP